MIILVNSSSVMCKTLFLRIGLLYEYLPGLIFFKSNESFIQEVPKHLDTFEFNFTFSF